MWFSCLILFFVVLFLLFVIVNHRFMFVIMSVLVILSGVFSVGKTRVEYSVHKVFLNI